MTDSASDETKSENTESPSDVNAVTAGLTLRYLVGHRQAIAGLSSCRSTVLIGALLVLSAGFALEYDGEDLLKEPWHLLIPHAASLLTSAVLFILVMSPTVTRTGKWHEILHGYPQFLGLFWMTAPIAWLYAIPVERWMSPGAAMRCNLCMLGIVSFWRVALIIRVISIVYDATTRFSVFVTVLLFGNSIMLLIMELIPVPILRIMGGVRLNDAESTLAFTRFVLILIGYPALLVWALWYLVLVVSGPIVEFVVPKARAMRVGRTAKVLVASSLAVWIFILPVTQPQQQNRKYVDELMVAQKFRTAFSYMSDRSPDDFPKHWSPPPQVAFPNQKVSIAKAVNALLQEDSAMWVAEIFLDKFRRKLPDVLDRFSSASEREIIPFLEIMAEHPMQTLPNDAGEFAFTLRGIRSNREFSDETFDLIDTIIAQLESTSESENAKEQPFSASDIPDDTQ